MYVQGASTRKVKAIIEELCGHAFSASAISAVNKTLDAELGRERRLISGSTGSFLSFVELMGLGQLDPPLR